MWYQSKRRDCSTHSALNFAICELFRISSSFTIALLRRFHRRTRDYAASGIPLPRPAVKHTPVTAIALSCFANRNPGSAQSPASAAINLQRLHVRHGYPGCRCNKVSHIDCPLAVPKTNRCSIHFSSTQDASGYYASVPVSPKTNVPPRHGPPNQTNDSDHEARQCSRSPGSIRTLCVEFMSKIHVHVLPLQLLY